MNVYLMYPDQDISLEENVPPNATILIQDLELNTLLSAMAQGDQFIFDIAKQVILSSPIAADTIYYRQAILKDCLRHPEIVRELYHIPILARENKQKRWMGIFTRYPTGILSSAREMLEMLVDLLKTLRHLADKHAVSFESQGFRRFFSMIQEELSDDFFAEVKEHLTELKFRDGVLISAELGKGNEGTNYILRKPNEEDRNWWRQIIGQRYPIYSYTLHPRDNAGARALGELRDRGVNLVANAVAQSAEHINSFLISLQRELAFYLGCLNLAEQLKALGEPIAFPQVAPANDRRLSFTGLYDVTLALTMKKKIVGNDIQADNKDLIIITGANQGGKSTFLRSIGLAQLMLQCGMFVPAESYTSNLCSGIFTHYKREEDPSMKSGKLDEELSRMSEIVDQITPNALLLCNESFASTNDREGSEIARQITRALLEKRIKIFFVTHLYGFARGLYDNQMDNALFLRAERKKDGERTFKLIEGEPLQTSFGIDVYQNIFGQSK